MGRHIKKLTIKGFKSIRSLKSFEIRPLNVLIGANGSGKSNFVSFFSLLRAMVDQALQLNVETGGGADAILHQGPKKTKRIVGKVYFGANGYEFSLLPTADNRLVFGEETVYFAGDYGKSREGFGKGHTEAKLKNRKDDQSHFGRGLGIPSYVFNALSSWMVYHFHDTSDSAAMRRMVTTRDYEELRADAGNIAAFLLNLRDHRDHVKQYELIRDSVRLVAPFFDDFKLRPEAKGNGDQVSLEWTQRGSNYPFQPYQLSDGTLRFICLATALLQPRPPSTILLDEPELGLHPYALNVLADLLKQAAGRTQVIVSTQSAPLLDYFEPEDIIVVDRKDGASEFRRLEAEQLSEWLKDYSLGELWQKNVFEGGPAHE